MFVYLRIRFCFDYSKLFLAFPEHKVSPRMRKVWKINDFLKKIKNYLNLPPSQFYTPGTTRRNPKDRISKKSWLFTWKIAVFGLIWANFGLPWTKNLSQGVQGLKKIETFFEKISKII